MKVYKCDICGAYCDSVLTIHGISTPEKHKWYEHLVGTSADCCLCCYDTIMQSIASMMCGCDAGNTLLDELRACIYFDDDGGVCANNILLQKFCEDWKV